jgi:hypothetical protein
VFANLLSEPGPPDTAGLHNCRHNPLGIAPVRFSCRTSHGFVSLSDVPAVVLIGSGIRAYNVLILARTGRYRKFNIEAQKCFCLFLPAAIASGKKIQATRFAGGCWLSITSPPGL